MKLCALVLLVSYLQNTYANNQSERYLIDCNTCNEVSCHEVDRLMRSLKNKRWSEKDEKCVEKTLLFLNGVRNHTLWATWIWDSIPKAASIFYGSQYHLGAYDQCLHPPWKDAHPELRTQYCLADIQWDLRRTKEKNDWNPQSFSEEYLQAIHPGKREINFISYGVCLLADCDAPAVTKIVEVLFEDSFLGSLDANIKIDSCQMSGTDRKFSTEYYAFMSIFTFLVIVAVISTWFCTNKTSNDMVTTIANCFCVKRNLKDISKVYENEMPAVNVLKAISILGSAAGHSVYFAFATSVINTLYVDKILLHPVGSLIFHVDVGVDTFYTVSGLLTAINSMKDTNPLKLIIMRYLRLVTPFGAMVLYTSGVFYHTGDGPIWDKLAKKEQEYCRKNWLWALLMLNNYVNDKEICQIVWWYIPTDFHMATLATIVIYLYKKNKIGNKTLSLIVLIIIAIPGVITYWNNYPPIPFHNIMALVHLRNNETFLELYMKTHNRIGAYIVGMAMGYFVIIYKPSKYRNIINSFWTSIATIITLIMIFGIIASGPAMLNREYNAIEAAFYVSLNRVLWSFCICVLIGLGEYGNMGFLRLFNKFSFFVPICHLGYCMYLTNIVIQKKLYSIRTPCVADFLTGITESFTGAAMTLAASVVLWLLVEAPTGHIITLLFKQKKSK